MHTDLTGTSPTVYYRADRAPISDTWRDRILAAQTRPLDPRLLAFIPCEVGWEFGGYPVVGWGLVRAQFALGAHDAQMVPVGSNWIFNGGAIEEGSEEDVLVPWSDDNSLHALETLRAPGELQFDFREERALLDLDRLRREHTVPHPAVEHAFAPDQGQPTWRVRLSALLSADAD